MKTARDVDLWLTKRLERPWTSEKITTGITPETIVLAEECFDGLDTNTKLNFLISFLAIRRPNMQKIKENVDSILLKAKSDSDTWVQIVSEVLTQKLSDSAASPSAPQKPVSITHEKFKTAFEKLSKIHPSVDAEEFYPLEYQYIDQSISSFREPQSHFTVKPASLEETFSWEALEPSTTSYDSDDDTKKQKQSKEYSSTPKATPVKRSSSPNRIAPNSPNSRGFMDISSDSILPKKRMVMLDIDEVRELQQQNTVKRRRRNDEETRERQRKKKEQQEEAKRKRQEEKLRKQQEAAERKLQAEREKEARKMAKQQEREAKKLAKLQQQTVKAQDFRHMQQPAINQPMLSQPFLGMSAVPSLRPILPPGMNNFQFQQPGTPGLPGMQMQYMQPPNIPQVQPQVQRKPPTTEELLKTLFESANCIDDDQKQMISDFMYGKSRAPDPSTPIAQLLLNEEQLQTEDGHTWSEQILFEINYSSGTWRKLRRRKQIN